MNRLRHWFGLGISPVLFAILSCSWSGSVPIARVVETNRALDFAIDGDGYFTIKRPDGQLGYTRDGRFRIVDGFLAYQDGSRLDPGISIPEGATDFRVSREGSVYAAPAGSHELSLMGVLELSRFPGQGELLRVEPNIFRSNTLSVIRGKPAQNGFGRIRQGALEIFK